MSAPTTLDLTGTWDIDPSHTRLGFAARHAMVATVRGGFEVFSGTIVIDHNNPAASSANVEIDATSIATGNEQRDQHLRGADFLEVENFTNIPFTSTAAEEIDADTQKLVGELTIKGRSHTVTLELDYQGSSPDPFGNTRAGFEGRTTINRKDWGLSWNVAIEGGGILVGEKVKLELDVSAIKRVTSDVE